MPNNSWFEVTAKSPVGPAFISIHGEIGANGVTASSFEKELRAVGKARAIDLFINSPGGDLFQANAIYSMLDRHQGRITVTIGGLAASGASLIAMAGDEIIMPSNSVIMLHSPSGGVLGTSRDIKDMADTLDKLGATMASTYARRSGQSVEAVHQMMVDETWFTAEEAVAAGFADRVEKPMAIAAHFADVVNAKFRHVPEAYSTPPKDMAELATGYWATEHAKREANTNSRGR